MQTKSLNLDLIELIFGAASIRRWNDQINPMEFTELDKQAHKMIIAWALAKCEEDRGRGPVKWRMLMEGAIFELLQRIILTDIKPPVFHRMMSENGHQLNQWVIRELEPLTGRIAGGFHTRMEQYLLEPGFAGYEKRILKAAHYLATQWEFNILYKLCPFIRGIEQIKAEIEDQIEDHIDLIGVQKIALGRKTYGFIDLCGQLRFQKRWSQSPRIPATSVLGHMLMVAILTYLALCDTHACEQRIVNGFQGALFHDLPEALTRDITSPVKNAVEGLADTIKKYESLQMEEKVQPLVPPRWYRELSYFTDNEFENRVLIDKKITIGLNFQELDDKYNDGAFYPIDGEIICCADKLAAYIEAVESIRNGVTSKHLQEGEDRLWKEYEARTVGPVDFGAVFASFRQLLHPGDVQA
ncbi:MAG: HD domain-containing protein [Lentisphaeria bacterium]|nr:HD domain-containing protein [Lentisphaeria bacterium]